MSHAFGWVDMPEAVAAFQMATVRPLLASFMGRLTARALPERAYLWEAHRKVTGALLPGRDQGQVGSCVGFGFARAVDTLACVEIATGDREEFREAAPEAIYGLSRVEIGGGRIPANEDGSTGAWAAQALMRYGVLARGKYDGLDLTAYSEEICRRLGTSGLPTAIESIAKQHPVRSAALVRSDDELRAALANGYPVAVCSMIGFERERDSRGVVQPGPQWAHCMAFLGYDGDRFFFDNSWGERFFTGPAGPGDPPPSGAWCVASVADRMVRAGDSYALSGFDGFPASQLDWVY